MSEKQEMQSAAVTLGSKLTHTFEVQSGIFEDMKGSITVALPDARGLIQMGLISARLRTDPATGQVTPDNVLPGQAQSMTAVIANLSIVVVKAPLWWYREDGDGPSKRLVPAPEAIQDSDLLYEIFGRYADWRETFRNRPASPPGDRQATA